MRFVRIVPIKRVGPDVRIDYTSDDCAGYGNLLGSLPEVRNMTTIPFVPASVLERCYWSGSTTIARDIPSGLITPMRRAGDIWTKYPAWKLFADLKG